MAPVREGQFVGMTADGEALVVELDGEHLRVPADARLKRAVTGDGQMRMPLEAHVSPREVQHRIRCGETAAEIAAASGVAVELIARFEGPVLDERRWHAERARATPIDGVRLEDLAAAADRSEETSSTWDSWLGEDGGWRVSAVLGDGRTAAWAWDPRTRRLRARDDLARMILSGDVTADDLDAVLRPLASARQAAARLEAVPPPPVEGEVEVEPTLAEDSPPAEPAKPKRRSSVPSWDEIMLGSAPRRHRPVAESGQGV